jgi:hypothetical protein
MDAVDMVVDISGGLFSAELDLYGGKRSIMPVTVHDGAAFSAFDGAKSAEVGTK